MSVTLPTPLAEACRLLADRDLIDRVFVATTHALEDSLQAVIVGMRLDAIYEEHPKPAPPRTRSFRWPIGPAWRCRDSMAGHVCEDGDATDESVAQARVGAACVTSDLGRTSPTASRWRGRPVLVRPLLARLPGVRVVSRHPIRLVIDPAGTPAGPVQNDIAAEARGLFDRRAGE